MSCSAGEEKETDEVKCCSVLQLFRSTYFAQEEASPAQVAKLAANTLEVYSKGSEPQKSQPHLFAFKFLLPCQEANLRRSSPQDLQSTF